MRIGLRVGSQPVKKNFEQVVGGIIKAVEDIADMQKARAGLVRKEVEVHRGGKTFKQYRWVKPDEVNQGRSKKAPEQGGGNKTAALDTPASEQKELMHQFFDRKVTREQARAALLKMGVLPKYVDGELNAWESSKFYKKNSGGSTAQKAPKEHQTVTAAEAKKVQESDKKNIGKFNAGEKLMWKSPFNPSDKPVPVEFIEYFEDSKTRAWVKFPDGKKHVTDTYKLTKIGKLGIRAGDKKQAATGPKPSVGDTITGTERGTGETITGKVTGTGKDGITVLSNDGTTHAVEWGGVEKVQEKSRKYVDPAKFSAGEWKQQWDDPKATPDEKGFNYVMESFGAESAEIVSKIIETEEKLKGITESWRKYRLSGEGESARYTDEREKLHGRIMQEMLHPDKLRAAMPPMGEKPTFMILGGRGGSGKSWFKNNVYDPSKFVILDADEIKAKLPEFDGWNAAEVHEESSDILEQMLTTCIKNGLNVVLDGTMKTAASALAKVFRMKSAGYRTEAHYMHLPKQEAAKRAIGRFKNGGQEGPNGEPPEPFTGRYVPVDVILKNTTNEDSFDQVKGLVDKWSFRDSNDIKRGEPPIIISEGENKKP
jgi:predicted kinase